MIYYIDHKQELNVYGYRRWPRSLPTVFGNPNLLQPPLAPINLSTSGNFREALKLINRQISHI